MERTLNCLGWQIWGFLNRAGVGSVWDLSALVLAARFPQQGGRALLRSPIPCFTLLSHRELGEFIRHFSSVCEIIFFHLFRSTDKRLVTDSIGALSLSRVSDQTSRGGQRRCFSSEELLIVTSVFWVPESLF